MDDPKQYAGIVLTGLAQLLQGEGLGTYRPDGTGYRTEERPITFGRLHPTSDDAIAITDYLDTPGVDTRVSRLYVQVRTRHSHFLDGRDLVDGIRVTLHRRTHFDLGQVRIGECVLDSFIPLGGDDRGRYEWSQNFRLTGLRALPPLTEGEPA